MLKRLVTARLLLRPAARRDAPVLRELVAGIPSGMDAPGLVGETAPAALEQILLAAEMDERRQLLLIEEKASGAAVGFLLGQLHHPWAGVAFVDLLLLAAGARRRGYGREACEAWHRWSGRKQGIREIQAAVGMEDEKALAFWTALGYRDTGQVHRDDLGHAFRILALRL